jgi:hypothetical protein
MKPNPTSLFSQDIYLINCQNQFDYLLKEVYIIKEKYENDYHTPELMYATQNRNLFSNESVLFPLKDFIAKNVNNIYSASFIRFTHSWINFSYKFNFQESHVHPESDITGVYYISYPLNSGKILIHNKNLNTEAYPITPYGGLLLLFRSDQPHSVEQSFSDDPRIALPFNIKFQ